MNIESDESDSLVMVHGLRPECKLAWLSFIFFVLCLSVGADDYTTTDGVNGTNVAIVKTAGQEKVTSQEEQQLEQQKLNNRLDQLAGQIKQLTEQEKPANKEEQLIEQEKQAKRIDQLVDQIKQLEELESVAVEENHQAEQALHGAQSEQDKMAKKLVLLAQKVKEGKPADLSGEQKKLAEQDKVVTRLAEKELTSKQEAERLGAEKQTKQVDLWAAQSLSGTSAIPPPQHPSPIPSP